MKPTTAQILAAIAAIEEFLPSARTLARALHLLRDPQSDIDDVAQLIDSDPALATEVLRCANSAYYGGGVRTGTVAEGVQKIGFRETIRLLNLVTAHGAATLGLPTYGIAAEDFWAESLFNGLFLDGLARRTNAFNAGEAYTTGLLRFIGRLALDQAVRALGGGLFWHPPTPLVEWERENAGLTHAEAGAQVLRRWKFPDAIVVAVEQQDEPAHDGIANPLALGMQFAALVLPAGMDEAFIRSLAGQPLPWPGDHPFAVAHRLTADDLAAVRIETHDSFRRVQENLYG